MNKITGMCQGTVLFFLLLFSQSAVWADTAMDSPFGFLDGPPDNFTYYGDLGTHWLRGGSGFDWADVEKVESVYDFSSKDTGLCKFALNGQNLLYAMRPINSLYGTRWVEGDITLTDEYPDGHVADYGDFIKAWVERYDGDGVDDAPCATPIRIKHYQFVHELWPDATADYWQNNREQYAEVFETIYTSMKEACSDCILYLPVPSLSDMEKEGDFLSEVLGKLMGKNLTDIGFDYHVWSLYDNQPPPDYWMTRGEDYRDGIAVINKIKEIASQKGFAASNIISAESGMGATVDMERNQAGYAVRSYVTNLAYGQKKQLWTTTFEYSHYGNAIIFDHTGLVHNPANSDGLSHKKLAYYTYKKMVELLDGSDWNNIQIVQESDYIYIYKFMKNGSPLYVVWWDYFNDPAYVSGATKQVVITGLQGSNATITEAVPYASSGAEVTDYNSAFTTWTEWIVGGGIALTVGESPVIMEVLGTPVISVSPATKDFGSVNSGSSSAAQTFTVTNSGTGSITIGAVSITGTDTGQFAIQSDTCSGQVVSPSGSCTVQVVFSPTSSGTKAASLDILSSEPGTAPATAALTGTGIQQYALTVAGAAGTSSGTVTGGGGISCSIAADGTASGACTETSNPGSSITLTAASAEGASVSWINCAISSGNTCIVTLDADKTITAAFNVIQVTADFSASIISGEAPNLTVTFTDLSANSPTSWLWTFGDGATSTLQNPSHVYENAGIYTVSLTVSNGGSTDTRTRTDYITVQSCSNAAVKLNGAAMAYYSTIQAAYNAASEGDVIKMLAQDINGDVTFNQDISVTLEGGKDCDYTTKVGETTINGALIIASGTVTVEGLVLSGVQPAVARPTFIMIHLEAGYKACNVANNLPQGLTTDVCSQGWQEYFWPTLIELVEKANSYGFKLTLAFTPQWAEFIANDSDRLDLVRQWKTQGHEIGFQHHPFTHIDWDGYSNEDLDVNDPLYPLFIGRVDDGFSYMNTLAPLDSVISSTMGGLPDDFPSLMTSPTLVYGVGSVNNSYPELGQEVKSLKPSTKVALIHDIERELVELTIRGLSSVFESISLEEALLSLQGQYRNMQADEVFGIVWHEYDYFKAKDTYNKWFEFIKQNGNSVKTMKVIAGEYFQ